MTDETLIAGIPMESLPGSSTAVYCGSFVKGLRRVRGVTTYEVNDDLDYEQIVLRDPDDSVSNYRHNLSSSTPLSYSLVPPIISQFKIK